MNRIERQIGDMARLRVRCPVCHQEYGYGQLIAEELVVGAGYDFKAIAGTAFQSAS